MKLLFFCVTLLFSCNSSRQDQQENKITNQGKTQNAESILVQEKQVQYKGGDNELLGRIYSSISNMTIDSFVYSRGIYLLEIDTTGKVLNSKTMRSINEEIDLKILNFCDTLSFYPAEINGKKVKSQFTFPIRVELR